MLADDDRRLVFAALVLGSATLDDVVVTTGLSSVAAAKALGRLVDGAMVVAGSDGGLRVVGAVFQAAVRAARASMVHVMIDGLGRGFYSITSALRPEADQLLKTLAGQCEAALLSGDNERERTRFRALFGPDAKIRFNQSPLDKLGFIERLQKSGRTVMMVGDGLNDAGALKQSDVGVAVVENIGAFSPASDVIMDASLVPRTHELLRYGRTTVRIVRAGFVVSTLYNVLGIAIAATGNLSPLVCAVLMPLSSVSVVAFACGMTGWAGLRAGLGKAGTENDRPGAIAGQGRPMEVKPA